MDPEDIEQLKRRNNELAANLSEKRIEARKINDKLIDKHREVQQLQAENAKLKMDLAGCQQQMQQLREIVIQTITANTRQYSHLMRAAGVRMPAGGAIATSTPTAVNTNGTAAISAPPSIQSVRPQPPVAPVHPIVPIVVVTSPFEQTASPDDQPQQQQQQHSPDQQRSRRRQSADFTRELSRSPSPSYRSPYGLSMVAEENTLDLVEETSAMDDSQSTNDQSSISDDDSIKSGTFVTKADVHRKPLSPLNVIVKKTVDKKKMPLKSTENIPKDNKRPKSAEKKQPANGRKKSSDKSSAPPKVLQPSEDGTLRPRRKAAPSQLVEPKMNTKLRRN